MDCRSELSSEIRLRSLLAGPLTSLATRIRNGLDRATFYPIFARLADQSQRVLCAHERERERERERTGVLVLAAIFACLASLTRYIGVTLIASSVLAILVVSRTSLKNRIFTAISFALLSATPLALWLVRNQFLTGTFMGERAPSQYSLYYNIYRTRNTLLGWFLPERFEPYYSELSLIAAVPAILIALYIVRNKRYVNTHLPVLFLLTVYCVV